MRPTFAFFGRLITNSRHMIFYLEVYNFPQIVHIKIPLMIVLELKEQENFDLL